MYLRWRKETSSAMSFNVRHALGLLPCGSNSEMLHGPDVGAHS
jgi:hypothetical protein